MDKIGKYNLTVATKMFVIIDKWLVSNHYSLDDVWDDDSVVQDLYQFIMKHFAIRATDSEDAEFLIAAYYENYKSCEGKWELLGNVVIPKTPKKERWVIEQRYREESIVYEKASALTYMPSFIKWDASEGNLDFNVVEQDVRDTYDYEITEVYVED